MFPFADTHLLSLSCSVLVKDHLELQTVARKEGDLKMLKYFCKSSPKISAPEDFVICTVRLLCH